MSSDYNYQEKKLKMEIFNGEPNPEHCRRVMELLLRLGIHGPFQNVCNRGRIHELNFVDPV